MDWICFLCKTPKVENLIRLHLNCLQVSYGGLTCTGLPVFHHQPIRGPGSAYPVRLGWTLLCADLGKIKGGMCLCTQMVWKNAETVAGAEDSDMAENDCRDALT